MRVSAYVYACESVRVSVNTYADLSCQTSYMYRPDFKLESGHFPASMGAP